MIICETERLYLREWVPDDWKRFRPLATDPRVLRYIGHGTPWTDEQIQARIDDWITLGRQRGWILWPVIHRDDAALIGFCGFWDGFKPDVEIGWRLLPEYWGQGIATEAARAVMDSGFQRFGFPRLISVAQAGNKASIRIMEKLGMEFERTFLHEGFEVVCYSKPNPALREDRTGGLLVRPYREDDEAEVVGLWETVFPKAPSWNIPAQDIRRKLAVQRELFLVGQIDGQVVGTTMAGFDGHRGWLHLVAVDPGRQRQGIGRAMMLEAERRLREIGCSKVNLQVRATNTNVVAFYESLGYSVEDRISMGKRLNEEDQGINILSDDDFLTAFEDGSLPIGNWNHRAHVRVAFLYLSRFELDEAIDRMRSGIKAYNAAHGVEDGPLSGYHETTTLAFMRLIHRAVQERGPFQDSHEFCKRCPELLDRRALLCYYTRDRIMEPAAKTDFVEPDLAPLDRIGRIFPESGGADSLTSSL